jgi:hypothetical protein
MTTTNLRIGALIVGQDYATLIGIESQGSFIYNGNSWTATKKTGETMTSDSAATTRNMLDMVQPSTRTGR